MPSSRYLADTSLRHDGCKIDDAACPQKVGSKMGEEKTSETSKSTTETKTNAVGIPEKDSAGEYVKETTTETEATTETDDDGGDGDED